ncbi:MAG: hypothetical protein IJY56_04000 [Clostridia bacterium]|nr:hypothetical protein [Clostridia bacterium]
MINVIVGNKGSGKTKKLISMVNEAVEVSKGNVVCLEKGLKLTYDLNYKARLIDTDVYGISTYDELYSFICGIAASDHDITDLFVDATLKIGGADYNDLMHFFDRLSVVAEESNTKFVFTVSCDVTDLPDGIQSLVNIL